MTIKLRGHHLLCLHGFRGYGYSPEFVANMASIRNSLLYPETLVEVIDSPDDICAACPNLSNDNCISPESGDSREESIRAKDLAVLNRVLIHPGELFRANHLFTRIADEFCDNIEKECSSCRWYASGWCEEGLRNRSMSQSSTDCRTD